MKKRFVTTALSLAMLATPVLPVFAMQGPEITAKVVRSGKNCYVKASSNFAHDNLEKLNLHVVATHKGIVDGGSYGVIENIKSTTSAASGKIKGKKVKLHNFMLGNDGEFDVYARA